MKSIIRDSAVQSSWECGVVTYGDEETGENLVWEKDFLMPIPHSFQIRCSDSTLTSFREKEAC